MVNEKHEQGTAFKKYIIPTYTDSEIREMFSNDIIDKLVYDLGFRKINEENKGEKHEQKF